MITTEKKDNVTPLCPHCETPQKTVYFTALGGGFGRRFIYFCASCKKVLGVSHRKGFWMG